MRRDFAALVFGCASVLLSYPDENFDADLAAIALSLEQLPRCKAKNELAGTQKWLSGIPPLEAATHYVETFDLQKRRSLHLTYYRHGDTRERGMALSSLVDLYRSVGFDLAPGELPDYLPALLELAAVSSTGAAVLAEHRSSIVLLRDALEKDKSSYTGVVTAILESLGGISKTDKVAIARYRAQGPPSEKVGLEPFAPPEVLGQKVVIR